MLLKVALNTITLTIIAMNDSKIIVVFQYCFARCLSGDITPFLCVVSWYYSHLFLLTTVNENIYETLENVDTSNKFVRVFDEIKMKILNLSDSSAHTAVYGYLPSVRFVTILRENNNIKVINYFPFIFFKKKN